MLPLLAAMKTASSALFLSAVILFSSIQVCAQEYDSPQEKRKERFIEHTGDLLMFGLPMVAGSATLFLEDKEGSKQFLSSLAFNLAMTTGIKYLINKPRPEGATDGQS